MGIGVLVVGVVLVKSFVPLVDGDIVEPILLHTNIIKLESAREGIILKGDVVMVVFVHTDLDVHELPAHVIEWHEEVSIIGVSWVVLKLPTNTWCPFLSVKVRPSSSPFSCPMRIPHPAQPPAINFMNR